MTDLCQDVLKDLPSIEVYYSGQQGENEAQFDALNMQKIIENEDEPTKAKCGPCGQVLCKSQMMTHLKYYHKVIEKKAKSLVT